jgi:tetratricopeptide (TPR) repeat protein
MTENLRERIRALRSLFQDLADLLGKAEEYLDSDPGASLGKARTVAEMLLLKVFAAEMGEEPKKGLLGDMLVNHQFTRKISDQGEDRILSLFNATRDMGNLGVHGKKVKPADARSRLADVCELLEWYRDRYQASAVSAPAPPRRRRGLLVLLAVGLLALVGLSAVWFLWPRSQPSIEEGKTLVKQGRYQEAIDCFEAVIARDPANSLEQAFPCRAAACKRLGNTAPREALDLYKEGLDLEGEKKYEEAVRSYRRAHELDPAMFWAANNLAYLVVVHREEKPGDLAEAARLADEACRRSGWACWHTLDTLAAVRAAQGDSDAAAQLIRKALALAPEAEKAKLNAALERYGRRRP